MSKIYVFLLSFFVSISGYTQLQATFTKTNNTLCDGLDCQWNGPSILINEMMMSPTVGDGSLWEPNCSANDRCGEWIELYNPNICQPVDVSCYHLGNSAVDVDGDYAGGYTIPQGTIVPPAGFLVIRGQRATPVPASKLVQNGGRTLELVVQNGDACIGGGTRLWYPNAGGWFAFYDANGIPQDAVSWGSSNTLGSHPCVVSKAGCPSTGQLQSYSQIPSNRKNTVYGVIPNSWGQSLRRSPDGGNWVTNSGGTPTIGACNSTCASPGVSNCNGTATINVTGGTPPYSYYWGDAQTQTTQTATGLCAGTYPVYVSDAANHHQTFTVTILDHEPVIDFSIVEKVCDEGQTVPITNIQPTATSGQTAVFTGTGVSGTNFNVSQAGTGTFSVKYTFTDEHGCTNSKTKDITVLPNPTPIINGLATDYCIDGGIIDLQPTPTGGTLSGTGIVNGKFDISSAGIGTHTIHYEVTTADGCFGETNIVVTVHDLPNVSAGSDQTICKMQSVTLVGSGASTYSWDNGVGTGNSKSTTPATTTTYTVIGTDNFGCKNTSQVTITVLDIPNVSAGNDVDICVGDSTKLTATGAINYVWDHGLGSGATHIVSPATTTTYMVSGSASNGCDAKAYVKVTVHQLPNVSAGGDFYHCVNAVSQVHAMGAKTYVWNQGLGLGATHDIAPQQSTTYVVKGIDEYGCVNYDSVFVKVILTLPTADFVTPIDSGCSPLSTSLVSLASSDVISCNWSLSNGQTLNSCGNNGIVIADTGCHDVTLTVVSDSGCVVSVTKPEFICVYPNPIADFNINPSSILLPFNDEVVKIYNHSVGAVTYDWKLPYDVTTNVEQPLVDFSGDTTAATYVIYLTVTSEHGCVDSTHRIFKLLENLIYYVPNTFTPDGDQYNNVFKPIFTYGFDFYDYEFLVFDRWGELIFETHNLKYGWDGTYKGKVCPDGTYVWKIRIRKRVDAKYLDLKGHINLIR